MPILAATNLKLAFGQRVILDGVSLSIEPGERVGVVGRNGSGKSSLLKILAGIQAADGGSVSLQRGARAGYLRQDPTFDPGDTLRSAAEGAFAELHRLHREQEALFEKMATAEGAELERMLRRQSDLERQVEAAGGYAIDHKIDAVLHGLGFTDAQFSIPVTGLSGGQRGRLALAELLLEEPDVLLLDEPTNHLDIEGCLWLESFLKNDFRGAVLLISHDRYLLDNVVTRIVETEQARLIDYPGNYEAFREIRAMRRLTQLRAFQNEQDRFKKEEAFIRRYRAGQRAKQAQGRLSKLERAKEASTLERPMEVEAFRLELPKPPRSGDVVLAARGIGKAYTNAGRGAEDGAAGGGSTRVLFHDLDVVISRGERWGVIGPNGAGKSTLVNVLLGTLAPDGGTVKRGSNVIPGHYRQTHDHVPAEPRVYEYLQSVIAKECPGTAMSEQQARNLAGAFLFSGSEQDKQMGMLSGGERSRVLLAALLASAKNLIVLDEPTNHLDIPSAERLEEALGMPDSEEESGDDEGYEGTVILISHDRALIDAVCDHLLVLDGAGNVETFHGNYSAWHERDRERRAETARAESEAKARREQAEKQRRAAEESRQRAASTPKARNPYAKFTTEQLEAQIAQREERIKEIDELMGTEDVWKNPGRCHALGEERARVAAELEPLEMEWMGRAE
ncbi:MAG: ABC-F family ATP-binding cassette domain-containing protein [Phycisphaerales bacterium]